MKTVNEVAKLTGVTVRTLQYYDKIGLLTPCSKTESRYRLYDTENLMTLQQILLYKELGFALNDIQRLLSSSDNQTRLIEQKSLLEEKKNRFSQMIAQIDGLIKGERQMDFEVFKNTVATKLPKETTTEEKERFLEQVTPELFEKVDEAWGVKEYLEMKPLSEEEILGFLQRAQEILREVIVESEADKIIALLNEWIEITMKFSQLSDRQYFVNSMKNDYQNDANTIAAVEELYGEGASKKLADLLEHYYEQIVN